MRKRILYTICIVLVMFTLTGCESDSIPEMANRFKEAQKTSDTFLDGLARYFTDYGWFYLVDENSLVDTTWDKAVSQSAILSDFPKLMDKIQIIELEGLGESSSINTIYQRDEQYYKSYDKYREILLNAGFECLTEGYDELSGLMIINYQKVTASGEKIKVNITGTKPKRPESYNVTIIFNNGDSLYKELEGLL